MRRHAWALVVVGALVAVGVSAGVAFAAVNIAKLSQQSVGEYANLQSNVTGVTAWQITTTTLPAAYAKPTGTAGAPQTLTGNANFCIVVTCTAGHWAIEYTFRYTTALAGSIQLPIAANVKAGGGTTTVYFAQATTAVAGTVHLWWDVGATAPSVDAGTFAIQQCHGALGTCP